MGLTSSTFDYIDDIPSFAVNCVFNLEIVVSTFGGAFYIWFGVEGFTCQAVESSEDFSMRCQCLVSGLLRQYVGKCGEYVVVKVRHSPASCFVCQRFFSITEFNPSNASFYGLLSVSSFLHVFDMLLFVHLERSFV